MRIFSLPKEFYYLYKYKPVKLSQEADQRMQKLNLWRILRDKGVKHNEINGLLRVSRVTLYRWQRRLNNCGPKGLEIRSRRPHRIRKPMWSVMMVDAVLDLREQYPGWGRDKLAVLLRRKGMEIS